MCIYGGCNEREAHLTGHVVYAMLAGGWGRACTDENRHKR